MRIRDRTSEIERVKKLPGELISLAAFLRSAEGWIPAEKCPKEIFLRALRVFGRNQLLFPRYASFTRLSASSSAPVPDMVMVPVSRT